MHTIFPKLRPRSSSLDEGRFWRDDVIGTFLTYLDYVDPKHPHFGNRRRTDVEELEDLYFLRMLPLNYRIPRRAERLLTYRFDEFFLPLQFEFANFVVAGVDLLKKAYNYYFINELPSVVSSLFVGEPMPAFEIVNDRLL